MNGSVRRLSDAELDELARITPADIDRARQFWGVAGSPEFREFLDATPEVTPAESGRNDTLADRMSTITTSVTRPVMEMMVFPIIKALYYDEGTEVHKIIGTGFFIDSSGLFLTARHVFEGRESALDLEGAVGFAVYCVHSVEISRRMVARRIDVSSIQVRRDTDIASGRVEMNQFGRANESITEADLRLTAYINHLTADEIPVGTRIWTVAFPLATVSCQPGQTFVHAQSDAFEGSITRCYADRRDSGMISWPCYEVDMEIKGGASGGPAFVSKSGGFVFGVNCSGFDPHIVSYISSLVPLIPSLGAA